MRDGGLGKMYAVFNVAAAEAGFSSSSDGRGTWTALLEALEDAAPSGIGNGVKRVVQSRGRGSHEIRNNS